MGLFDLVKEDDIEGLFLHRVGQLTACVIAHIAGRRTKQLLIGVRLLVFTHIEPGDEGLVTEDHFRDCLCQLCFTGTGRSGEEQHTLGTGTGALLDTGQTHAGTLQNLRSQAHRLILTLHPALQQLGHLLDHLFIQLIPMAFHDAELVVVHGLFGVFDLEALGAAHAQEIQQVEGGEALCQAGHSLHSLFPLVHAQLRIVAEGVAVGNDKVLTQILVDLRNGDIHGIGIVQEEPGRQVICLFHDIVDTVFQQIAGDGTASLAGLLAGQQQLRQGILLLLRQHTGGSDGNIGQIKHDGSRYRGVAHDNADAFRCLLQHAAVRVLHVDLQALGGILVLLLPLGFLIVFDPQGQFPEGFQIFLGSQGIEAVDLIEEYHDIVAFFLQKVIEIIVQGLRAATLGLLIHPHLQVMDIALDDVSVFQILVDLQILPPFGPFNHFLPPLSHEPAGSPWMPAGSRNN